MLSMFHHIRTWYDEKQFRDKFMPFLNKLTAEEVIQAVKNDEVKAIFLGSFSVIMNGQLNMQKLALVQ